jgi:hypothetical protein
MGYEKDELIRELRNFQSTINEYLLLRHSLVNEYKKSGHYPTNELDKWKKHQEKLQILYGKLEQIIIAISGKTIGDLPFEKALSTGALLDTDRGSQPILDSIDMIPILIGKVEVLSDNQCRKFINKSDAEILIEYIPKVFIAHGGQSKALEKLRYFLEALGLKPVVAETEPSGSRSTEGQVDKCMSDADCAIILATYGYIEDRKTGHKHPRLNVVDELGRCRKVFPNRTILLLQNHVELPSNDKGIVYERFTKQSMDKAFIKVAKELTEFGLLRAVKVK